MEEKSEAKEKKETFASLSKLIRYHEYGLSEHICTMSITSVYLEKQTILALKKLQAIMEK